MSRYADFREVECGGEVYRVAVFKRTGRAALVQRKLPPARDFDHAKGWRDLWRAGLKRPNPLCAEVIQISGHPLPEAD
jgi:hypothetical protein